MKTYQLRDGAELIIRSATVEDAAEMVSYVQQVGGESDFLTFGAGEMTMTIEDEKSFIESVLKAENRLFIVATIDEKIVGNLGYTGGGRPRIRHTGEFGVSVLKKYWGQGIGEKLIKYLIEWSRDTEIVRKINLRVRSDNTTGINLYKKLGFKEEGRQSREFYVEGVFYDSIMLGLEID